MRDGVILSTDEVREIIAEHFDVPIECVLKAKYSYIVAMDKDDKEKK